MNESGTGECSRRQAHSSATIQPTLANNFGQLQLHVSITPKIIEYVETVGLIKMIILRTSVVVILGYSVEIALSPGVVVKTVQ